MRLGDGVCFPVYDQQRVRFGRWFRARPDLDGDGEGGFHAFATRDGARALSKFWNEGGKGHFVVRVRVRGVVAEGTHSTSAAAQSTALVANEMFIPMPHKAKP
jgi:hypothetical protein